MALLNKKLMAFAGLFAVLGMCGCSDDDSSGSDDGTCTADMPSTCADSIMTYCENGFKSAMRCEQGCDGNKCKGSTPVQTCSVAESCSDGVHTFCSGSEVKTETCADGCEGNKCKGSTPVSGNYPFDPNTCAKGSKAANATSNQYTFTGCACDEKTYQKTCGTVGGVDVVYMCYKGDEEWLQCNGCTVDKTGYYKCKADEKVCMKEDVTSTTSKNSAPGGGKITEVSQADAEKYATDLGITKAGVDMYDIEKAGESHIVKDSDGFEVETCDAALTISDSSNTCEATGDAKAATVVIRGDILTKDKIIKGGAVAFKGNKITAVGCNVDTTDARVITCPNAVVSAGLINAHDHLTFDNQRPDDWGAERFDHRHDWRKAKNCHTDHNGKGTSNNEVHEMRMLLSGTTAMFGSGAGKLIRTVDKTQVEGANQPVYQTFPLGDNGGNMLASGCKYSYNTSNGYFGPHIGEGINDAALNELKCLSGEGTGAKNIFSNKLAIIHGVAATPSIIQKMANANSKLIWSPRTNVSLYGDTARVTVYDNMGVTIALGTDWILSGSANMLREYECADYLNTYYFNKHFSDYQIWMMGTYNSALALGLENSLGDLAKDKLADIAVYAKNNNRDAHRAVIAAENKDVTLVVIDGKIVMGDANIMTAGTEVDMCGSAKKVNTELRGSSFAYNTVNGLKKYDLFFCGRPDSEPTCVPMRTRVADTTFQGTTLYDGEYSDMNDIDGDGIPNDVDNCPNVFNPVRPEDKDASNKLGQGDWDGDGVGDVCDAAPMDASKQ